MKFNPKKHFLLPLFGLVFISHLNAQDLEPQSQFAQDFLPVWEVSTRNALDVAEAMPENLYGYKPNDSSMTFGDQVGHIAFTVKFLSDGFLKGEWSEYKNPDTSEMTKAEVIELLRTNIEKATTSFCGMTNDEANEVIQAFGGRELKRYVTFLFIQDHLTNHKAKANLYIRMNGLTPPDYAFFN